MRTSRGLAWFMLLGVAACIPSRRGTEPQPQPTAAPVNTWPAPTATATETAWVPPASAAPAPAPPPPVVEPKAPRVSLPRFRVPKAPSAHPPAPAPTAATGCGQVTVDGVIVPLDCWSKDYVKLEGASTALARPSMSATTAIPDYVDHRRDKLVGPVRHQRSVGSGAALAVASAIDQVLMRGGQAGAVSALHLFARAPRSNLGATVSATLGKGVTSESALPYDEAVACNLAQGDAGRLCKDKRPLGADAISKADAAPLVRVTDIVELGEGDGAAMRETLTRGQDVVLVLRVDAEAWGSLVKTADPEPLLPDYVGAAAIQPVLVVGFAKQDGAWFFLLKNSWGTSWGAGGFAWISESTLRKNAIEAYVVQATLATALSTPLPATCPAGTVPDSVTKQCAPACPDKSPRNNGVCADPKSACPPGFVNTTGRCVVAAPTTNGSDPATGISFACGAAGCTYVWPKGKLGCAEATCSISCPAPKHLAAVNTAKRTVTCTE